MGGETAEMPGMYKGKDFDLAGFAVGIVDKNKIIQTKKIRGGELLIGLPSSGPHSNGYSLIRKLFFEKRSKFIQDKRFINSVMKPTRIYVDIISSILTKIKVKGMAHITGGGLVENIPRILPKGMGIEIYHSRIPKNKLFKNIQDYSGLNFEEMIKVFNIPDLIAIAPPMRVKTIVVIQPKALENMAISPFEKPISL